MIVLAGASASGKTEIAKLLASKYGITKIVTTTTRPKRKGEVNGVDYFFVTPSEFEKMIREDKFVEYTHYNGNYYGSTKDQIANDRVVVIDLEGLKSYSRLNDKRIVTFYLSTCEEIRYKRMLERGDKEEDAKRRIENDRKVFDNDQIPDVDYKIDSENRSIEEVADLVYQLYTKHLGL